MITATNIFIGLVIVYTIILFFKESYQRKWYRRGYVDGARKYDKNYADRRYYQDAESHETEGDKKFHEQYGFH